MLLHSGVKLGRLIQEAVERILQHLLPRHRDAESREYARVWGKFAVAIFKHSCCSTIRGNCHKRDPRLLGCGPTSTWRTPTQAGLIAALDSEGISGFGDTKRRSFQSWSPVSLVPRGQLLGHEVMDGTGKPGSQAGSCHWRRRMRVAWRLLGVLRVRKSGGR